MIEAIVDGQTSEVLSQLAGLDPSRLGDFDHFFGEMPGQLFWQPLAIAAALAGPAELAAALLPLLEDSRSRFAVHIPGAMFLGSGALHVGALRACLGDLDGAVADLEAAGASNEAIGAGVAAATCRWLLADVLAQRGLPNDAAAARVARQSARSIAPEFDPAASPLVKALQQHGG